MGRSGIYVLTSSTDSKVDVKPQLHFGHIALFIDFIGGSIYQGGRGPHNFSCGGIAPTKICSSY